MTPREEKGLYWGYDVRIAKHIKEAIADYDVVLLCNHSEESHGLHKIHKFKGEQLRGSKVLVIFAGTDDLG